MLCLASVKLHIDSNPNGFSARKEIIRDIDTHPTQGMMFSEKCPINYQKNKLLISETESPLW